jgi:leader peptidase (prepilin peptidase) / N-methyltransferase
MLRLAVFGLFGLAFGSFLTVVVHRVPRKESIVRPGSRCPRCGTPLRTRDNVPLFGYLLLRGRCRRCGERISPIYPLMELASGALFVATAIEFDRGLVAGIVAPFLGVMVALAMIDLRHKVLPNRIVYPSLVIAAAAIAIGALLDGEVDAARAAIGFAAYGGSLLLLALLYPAGLGMGDVKLVALIGLILGSISLSHVAVAAGAGIAAGGVFGIGALLVRRAGRKTQMPFGPFLAAGAVVAAFLGPEIADLYLSTLT